MGKTVNNHATIRPNGNVYIPPSFLTENGWTAKEKVTFFESEDGLSFTMKLGEGKINMTHGQYRIGIKIGNDMIRNMMKNKPSTYPYSYKGVYVVEMVGDDMIKGTLVSHQVPSISLIN